MSLSKCTSSIFKFFYLLNYLYFSFFTFHYDVVCGTWGFERSRQGLYDSHTPAYHNRVLAPITHQKFSGFPSMLLALASRKQLNWSWNYLPLLACQRHCLQGLVSAWFVALAWLRTLTVLGFLVGFCPISHALAGAGYPSSSHLDIINVCFLSPAGMFHNCLFMILAYLLTQEKENPMRVKVIIFRLGTFKCTVLQLKQYRCNGLPLPTEELPSCPCKACLCFLAKTSPSLRQK